MNLRLRWLVSMSALIVLGSTGCVSSEEPEACTVATVDGQNVLECPDGTSVVIDDGEDGTSCTVEDNGNDTHTISCEDGTEAIISAGGGAESCSVVDNDNGTATVTCPDGSEQTFDISGEDTDPPETEAELEIVSFGISVDGDDVTFEVDVKNNGPADIEYDEGEDSGGVFVDFFLDEDGAPSAGEVGDVDGWIPSLESGATITVSEVHEGADSGDFDGWVALNGHNDSDIMGDVEGPEPYTVD